MKNGRYDVVILGGGNAGIGVTVATRKAGKSVALIESWVLGGTCPNRGCTPKKVLVAASHSLHEIERAKVQCIAVGEPRLDWAALIDREKDMISHIPNSLAKLMKDHLRFGCLATTQLNRHPQLLFGSGYVLLAQVGFREIKVRGLGICGIAQRNCLA